MPLVHHFVGRGFTGKAVYVGLDKAAAEDPSCGFTAACDVGVSHGRRLVGVAVADQFPDAKEKVCWPLRSTGLIQP